VTDSIGEWAPPQTKDDWGERILAVARIDDEPRKVYGELKRLLQKRAAKRLLTKSKKG